MNKDEKLIKKWVEDDNISLMTMFDYALDRGYTEFCVETQEYLREYVCEMIREGVYISKFLNAIEEDGNAELFAVDLSCGNLSTPKGIYTKQELADAIW